LWEKTYQKSNVPVMVQNNQAGQPLDLDLMNTKKIWNNNVGL
jgi:hypothetical protein